MPARQRGRVEKLPSGKWSARYYDERPERQRESGFATKTAARDWLARKMDEVEALRRGDAIPVAHRPATVDALLDLFIEKHGRTLDPGTLRTDKSALKHARKTFGDRHPDSLN